MPSNRHRSQSRETADASQLASRVRDLIKRRQSAERERDRWQTEIDEIDAVLAPISNFPVSGSRARRGGGSARPPGGRREVRVPDGAEGWREWFRALAPLQAAVVATLVESPLGVRTPPEAADRLGRTTKSERASVTTTLSRLARDGFLARDKDAYRLLPGAQEALVAEQSVKEALLR